MGNLLFLSLLSGLLVQDSSEEDSWLPLTEIDILSGYTRGSLDENPDDLETIPLAVHFSFDLNPLLGFGPEEGGFQLGLEPFWNTITQPESDIEFGLDFFLRWRQPFSDSFAGFIELGAGPMYFGLDTDEQEDAGFNFLDQLGVGTQIYVQKDLALHLGMRWKHISHGRVRDGDNDGIDSASFVVGLAFFY